MAQKFEVLQNLVKHNVMAINHQVLVYSSLKDILVRLYKLNYIESNLSDVDIRTIKGKEIILQHGKDFTHAALISRHNLLKRNWTNDLINEYLQYPDLSLKNEKVRMGKECYLYSLCRVKCLETIPEVAQKLRANEAAGIRTEQNNIVSIDLIIKNIDFDIEVMPLEVLIKKAITHFNQIKTPESKPATRLSTPDKLERICMNYLRHQCSTYEEQFIRIFNVKDYTLACDLLKKRVNSEIKKLYPNLKSNIYKYKSGLVN